MTKQISFQDIYSRIIIFFDQTLRRPSIPILVSVKHPMSNTRFKSMQNDLHTSLLHGQLSRLETGGGEVVGGLLFCWGVFLPQSATHTVTQSADTALAMRLERNEKPTCASVKRANGGLSPSTKINCEQGRTWHRCVISYTRRGRGSWRRRLRGRKSAMFPPCVAAPSTFQLRPDAAADAADRTAFINSWRERGRRWKMNVVSFPLGMTSQTLWMWRRVCFAPCEMLPFCFVF